MDLKAITNKWWNLICKKVRDSVVFIDDGAAECLHWSGGLIRLLSSGASEVHEFSSFEGGGKLQKKSVFLLTKPVVATHETILCDIIQNSDFNHCVIITTVHPSLQYFTNGTSEITDEVAVIQLLKEKMINWMRNKTCIVEIECQPMFLASICPALFVTPPFSHMFPLLPVDLKVAEKKSYNVLSRKGLDLELSNLPEEVARDLSNFVHCFNNLLEELNVREDCFTVGQFSKLIANLLDALPAARYRRKIAPGKVSVLFVDRTLDLVGTTSHGVDTLLDRIMNMLPKLPNHSNDVAIEMYSLCAAKKVENENLIPPGCLAQDNDELASTILNSLVVSKHKECLLEINRYLVEAISKEKLSPTPLKPGRLNPDTLQSHINLFKNKYDAIKNRCGLLQHVLGVIQTLRHSNNAHMDQLYGIEKGLLHVLGDEIKGTNAIFQITQLINTRKERSITLEDTIILLVHLYSLAGENLVYFSENIEQLQESLQKAILEDINQLPEELKMFCNIKTNAESEVNLDESDYEDNVKQAVEDLFLKLQDTARVRQDFKKYRAVFEPGGRAQPACYLPFLRQIFDDISNSSRPELLDIEYKSMGLKDMIKSGFSMFLSVNKPHPSDNSVIIIYIVGGITSSEVRLIKETIAARKLNIQILIGSTRIVTPGDILKQILNPFNMYESE